MMQIPRWGLQGFVVANIRSKAHAKECNEAVWRYQATLMPVNTHFAKSSLSYFVDYAVAYLTLTNTL